MDVALGSTVLTYGREGCTDFAPGFTVASGQSPSQIVAGLHKFRIDSHGILKMGNCRLKVSLLNQYDTQIVVGFRQIGVELKRGGEVTVGIVQSALLQQLAAKIVLGGNEIRLNLDRFIKMMDGLFRLILPGQSIPQVELPFGIIRPSLQRLA